MIFHISIPVDQPRHVAKVIAEIIGGPVVQFVPAPEAFFVFAKNSKGVGLEFIPRRLTHTPGRAEGEGVQYVMESGSRPEYSGGHIAMAALKSTQGLKAIADREGWRSISCWRATAFPVFEMWIENHYMIEWCPSDVPETLATFYTPENYQKYFNMTVTDGVYMASGRSDAARLAQEQVKLSERDS